jgi:hypothetical protein
VCRRYKIKCCDDREKEWENTNGQDNQLTGFQLEGVEKEAKTSWLLGFQTMELG